MERELMAQLARITDPDPLMRADAASKLGALNGADTASALLNALNDREWRVRAAAAGSLGQLAERRATIPLCRLLGESRLEVRRAAVISLEQIGDVEATAMLLITLDTERDAETRRLIARALGRIGDRRALRPLQQLTGDKHWAVRREAAASVQRLIERTTQTAE